MILQGCGTRVKAGLLKVWYCGNLRLRNFFVTSPPRFSGGEVERSPSATFGRGGERTLLASSDLRPTKTFSVTPSPEQLLNVVLDLSPGKEVVPLSHTAKHVRFWLHPPAASPREGRPATAWSGRARPGEGSVALSPPRNLAEGSISTLPSLRAGG